MPEDVSSWSSFTHIDFIVSSPKFTGSIKESGTSQKSDDITGDYNTEEDVQPYMAESVPFEFFLRNAANSQSRRDSMPYSFDELDEFFIKTTIGTGSCLDASADECQNGKLKSHYEYLYALEKLT